MRRTEYLINSIPNKRLGGLGLFAFLVARAAFERSINPGPVRTSRQYLCRKDDCANETCDCCAGSFESSNCLIYREG